MKAAFQAWYGASAPTSTAPPGSWSGRSEGGPSLKPNKGRETSPTQDCRCHLPTPVPSRIPIPAKSEMVYGQNTETASNSPEEYTHTALYALGFPRMKGEE